MQLEEAEKVVAALQQRRVFAHVYNGGVARHGVRIVLPDGREALWDVDGAAGLVGGGFETETGGAFTCGERQIR